MPRSRTSRSAPSARRLALAGVAAASLLATAGVVAPQQMLAASRPARRSAARQPVIRHVVEIMLENHTFDALFGHFPGADGIPANVEFPNPDTNYTATPLRPITAPANVGDTVDMDHNRAAEIMAMDYRPTQLAGGKGFFTGIVPSNSFAPGQAAWKMNYYTTFPYNGVASITNFPPSLLPNETALARDFALADRNFQPAIGPTQPNRIYAVAATAKGWISDTPPPHTLPIRTVFDELQAHGRSWEIYQGDYDGPPPTPEGAGFVTHWNPAWYTPILADKHLWSHVANTSAFLTALAQGRLPSFSFVVPTWLYSEHPPTDIELGDAWIGQLLQAIMHSPQWRSTAVFITYDEGGGEWDHVSPPIAFRYGYGTRTPMVVVSPWVRPGIIRATTTNMSILSFMQHLWHMPALNRLNARQNDLLGDFDFHQTPLAPITLPNVPPVTLEASGPGQNFAATPGAPYSIQVQAKNAGLSDVTSLSGPLSVTVVPPAGVPAPSVPAGLDLTDGQASFTMTFPVAGYYRLLLRGPDGSLGWVTIDNGVGNDSTP